MIAGGRFGAALIALAVLGIAAAASLWALTPPTPAARDAPASDFSAARAFDHVLRIGSQPHPAGSRAADDVRAYVETTLRGLGIETEVQDAIGAKKDVGGLSTLARVRNVVGVLPGTASSGRVILVAHTDSVAVSFGANDDSAGVATLLETARALAAGTRQRNDVVFLFTDAEELCSCGAEAFVSQHPLGAGGGVVVDLEAHGSGGPAVMFEATAGSAALVDLYGAVAPNPVASSFAAEVYRSVGGWTDFAVFARTGRFAALDFIYLDGAASYHSPQDTPARLDQASLQHMGTDTLALALAFAAADLGALSTPSSDPTYFPVLGLLVRYPSWLVWPIAVLALLAALAAALLAMRRGEATRRQLVAGFAFGVVPVVLAAAAGQVLWLLLVALRPAYAAMLDPWQPGWFRAALIVLVAAVLLAWYGPLRRRVGTWALAIGGLGWLALAGLVLAALAPGGSYLMALPALAAALAMSVALALRRPLARLAVVTFGAVCATLILVPTIALLFPAVGLPMSAAVAVFVAALGITLLPVLEWVQPDPTRMGRWWSAAPAAIALLLAGALLGVGLGVDRFDVAHPERANLSYALDVDTGLARWVSRDAAPGEWTKRYVTGREDLTRGFWPLIQAAATGPAPAAQLTPAAVTVVDDAVSGAERTLTLRIVPKRAVGVVAFVVRAPTGAPQARVVRAAVNGREVSTSGTTPQRPFAVQFFAPGPDGIAVTLVIAGTSLVELQLMDGSYGLAGLPGFTARPDAVGVWTRGSADSDLAVVTRTYVFWRVWPIRLAEAGRAPGLRM